MSGIVVLDRDDTQVVVLLREEDLRSGLADLRWHLADRVLGGATSLTVDLSSVDRLSSMAIAVLLRAKRCCRARGGRVVLRSPSPGVVRMLRRTGLEEVFDVETGVVGRGRVPA